MGADRQHQRSSIAESESLELFPCATLISPPRFAVAVVWLSGSGYGTSLFFLPITAAQNCHRAAVGGSELEWFGHALWLSKVAAIYTRAGCCQRFSRPPCELVELLDRLRLFFLFQLAEEALRHMRYPDDSLQRAFLLPLVFRLAAATRVRHRPSSERDTTFR